MVNRELLRELCRSDELDIRHIPFEPDQFSPENDIRFSVLGSIPTGPHDFADIHVRQKWPPDLSRPETAYNVLFQPWEYGSMPIDWVKSLGKTVDEYWVYTDYLKRCYVRSGMDEEKVKVITLGIDPEVFHPGYKPLAIVKEQAGNRYCFMFNGGATLRKGVDILVNAYLNEFRADEPVALVIKDSCAYGKDLSGKIEALAKRNDIAKLIYLNVNIDQLQLPALYASCDCYVHPYRAEGFGLPIIEALACGVPVITTGGGACKDFTDDTMVHYVACHTEVMPQKEVSGIKTVDHPFWLVPETSHLQEQLRYVYTHKDETKTMGMNAGIRIRTEQTWEKSAHNVMSRLAQIASQNGTDKH
jgi:glycosyltransferase involved in cell wall biosynthesis